VPASAVLLAAGASARFGGAKLLAEVRGEPLVRRSARALLEGGVGLLLVVTGARGEAVAEVLRGLGGLGGLGVLEVVPNPRWESGMFSSVKAGLAALPPGTGPVAVTPADLPGLSSEDVRRLLEAAKGTPGSIAVPSSGGRRGHPILLPRTVAEAVASWPETERLDRIFRERSWPVVHVEGFGPGVLRDADTPGDLAAALAHGSPVP
jgi:molybdenum cofactor cytidylyltransferase